MSRPLRRVVITGIGVVSPNGVGREAFARACREGVSGLSKLDGVDPAKLRTTSVGRVRAEDWTPQGVMEPNELRRVPRMVPMALQASREAMAQSGIQPAPDDVESQRQVGVSLGTGGGGLAFVEEQYRTFFTEGTGSLFSITAGTHGNLSSELSIALHLRGPSHVLSTGCTSSTDAIGYAAMLIRTGVVPAMLAGGADAPISAGILTDAGVAKDDVGYVNLHGTGTELNDRMETAALRKCFGPRADRVPMSATKSMIGHPQGACGAAGLAATVLGMREGFVHPTLNLDRPDPQCDLDYTPKAARSLNVDVALCNCIAFGSKNSALVVGAVA